MILSSLFCFTLLSFHRSLTAPVPPEDAAVDVSERPELIWWKEKKWAMHILTRIFERYGSPGNVMAEYKEFSEWFLRTFSAGILDSVLKVLAAHSSGSYVSPRVVQQCLNFVNTAVSHSHTWRLVKPHVQQVRRI